MEVLEITDMVRELQVSDTAGNVTIQAGQVQTLTISALIEGEETQIDQSLVDQILSLKTICGDGWFSACAADYEITVPEGLVVRADGGSGNVRLVGMRADANLISGSGNIAIESFESESLVFDAGSGNVTGQGIAAVQVEGVAGSGDVTMELVSVPQTVSIDAGSGDITLTLPADTYDVQATSGANDIDIQGITTESSSTRKLVLSAGSGRVTIIGK